MSEMLLSEIALNWPRLLAGLRETVVISLCAVLFGTLHGAPLGVAMFRSPTALRILLAAYVDLIRGTPVLVLVLASYYIVPLIGPNLSASLAGVVALALFCGAQIAEITRGSLRAIDKGQMEAAKSIGLRFHQALLYILLPQALRIGLPAWMNCVIEAVKGSSLLLIIGVAELMLTMQQIVSRNFMSIQFMIIVGLIYFIVNYTLECAGKFLERRISFERRPGNA